MYAYIIYYYISPSSLHSSAPEVCSVPAVALCDMLQCAKILNNFIKTKQIFKKVTF